MSKSKSILYVTGMALFWPFFAYMPYSGMLHTHATNPLLEGEGLWYDALYVIGLVVAAVAGIVIDARGRRGFFRGLSIGTLAATVAPLMLTLVLPDGPALATTCYLVPLTASINVGLLAFLLGARRRGSRPRHA